MDIADTRLARCIPLLLLLPMLAVAATRDESPEPLEGGRKGARALVVVLHGGSFKPRTQVELARDAVAALSSTAEELGLRLLAPLAPDSPGTTPWLDEAGEARMLALVDLEVRRRRAHRDRVYLAGHGSGATAAIHLAARHPERFAAIACWSGTPSPVWDDSRNVVGLVDDPVPRLRDVPVYLWTGSDDRWLDRSALQWFVDDFAARATGDDRFHLTWEEGEGGHGYGRDGPTRGLAFLTQHRKPTR